MNTTGTSIRVTAFAVTLAAVFALSLGLGRAFGPDPERATAAPHGTHGSSHAHEGGEEGAGASTAALPGGLMTSQDGYTLSLAAPVAAAGVDVPVAFTITGPDGEPVTDYAVEHEKRLHLVVVRRDLTGFQHVHPELAPDRTWTTTLDLAPGQWRLLADFRAAGADALTLGADLAVPGRYRPVRPAAETRTAEVDGYTVTLDGDLSAGADARLTLRVSRGGTPVTDLQPYLGAYGHLVALREGDLAYLHVHPDGAPGDGTTRPGPEVVFHAAVPSVGTYHLYLDFRHAGVVRTAAFTVSAPGRDG
jgi:hypothetical protein